MGRKSKQKGYRGERQAIETLIRMGFDAERVPLSGALGGKHAGDIVLFDLDGEEYRGEVKVRKDGTGFATLYKWIEDHPEPFWLNEDFLVLSEEWFESLVLGQLPTLRFMENGYPSKYKQMRLLYRWFSEEITEFLMVKKDRHQWIFLVDKSMIEKVNQ